MTTTRIGAGHYRITTGAGLFDVENIGGTWLTSIPGRREGFHADTYRDIKRIIGAWTLYPWSRDFEGSDGVLFLRSIRNH